MPAASGSTSEAHDDLARTGTAQMAIETWPQAHAPRPGRVPETTHPADQRKLTMKSGIIHLTDPCTSEFSVLLFEG